MGNTVQKTADFEEGRRRVCCERCLEPLPPGAGYYELAGLRFCRECLPRVAEAFFLPWLRTVGEEVPLR